MPRRTILDEAHASLYFHEEEMIVHHHFKKYVHGSEFRDVLSTGRDLLIEKGAKKWLSDDRHNGVLFPEDEHWANTEWAPKVVAAGWKYWAVVLPSKVIGQMNMERFIDEYKERGITAHPFADPDEALEWLKAQ